MSDFIVEFYEAADGTKPMVAFLDHLNGKLAAKVVHDIGLLKQFGNQLREPYSKYLAEGIFELRTKQSTNITRSFYFFQAGGVIVMTHGIVKKRDATPIQELNRAIRYKTDWERRHHGGAG